MGGPISSGPIPPWASASVGIIITQTNPAKLNANPPRFAFTLFLKGGREDFVSEGIFREINVICLGRVKCAISISQGLDVAPDRPHRQIATNELPNPVASESCG